MSIAHSASRLVSAANRHGILIPPPKGSSVEIPTDALSGLRLIVGEESLPSGSLNAVQAGILARDLNKRADESIQDAS